MQAFNYTLLLFHLARVRKSGLPRVSFSSKAMNSFDVFLGILEHSAGQNTSCERPAQLRKTANTYIHMLLFNLVIYVFLLLYLRILIVTYVLFCIFCFHVPTGTLRLP
jgi:hypothetical protein